MYYYSYILIPFFLLSSALFLTVSAQTEITFQVNMQNHIDEGVFDPENHAVELTGDLGPLRISGSKALLPSESDSTIYKKEVAFPAHSVGRELQYRFQLNLNGRVEKEDNPRLLRIPDEDEELDALFFNSYAW
ncbi:hypothetical protein [Natronogracilivirga saccharolytica]|uniref:Uncharacterized protein n=1 Tax=Natronogracilivirga saccharolytica TaxID=2812953 RepID=A0A8J7UUX1_9BACT|nr:hypothetical protein [Natronogracilivirga saccharolytica]MBP3191911.1 hypothetical protein [Natronogracilivirga saccharolytica]